MATLKLSHVRVPVSMSGEWLPLCGADKVGASCMDEIPWLQTWEGVAPCKHPSLPENAPFNMIRVNHDNGSAACPWCWSIMELRTIEATTDYARP